MRYLALDIASITGWVVMDTNPNKIINFGKIIATGSIKSKITTLHKKVCRIASLYQIEFVIFEDIFFYKNAKGFKILAYMQAACMLAVNHRIPIIALSSRSVRKVLGIQNKMRDQIKQDVVLYINKELNLDLNVKDHNDIADALLLILSYLKDKTQYTLDFGDSCKH